MSVKVITLPRAGWQILVDHLEACLPEEGCGLLAGREGRIELVLPIENIEHSPTHYRMEARALVASLLRLEDLGCDLLAAFHSHPRGPLGVSQDDLREWQYPEAAQIICVPRQGTWTARAYFVAGAGVREIPFSID